MLSPAEAKVFIQHKIDKHYKKIHWSDEEKGFLIREKYRRPCLVKNTIPLTLALRVKVQKSSFGRFMKCFNEDQRINSFLNFNKLGVEDWNVVRHTWKEDRDWKYNHNFTEDAYDLLKKAVETEDCIDYDFIYNNLTDLRLIDCAINSFDSVRKLKFLEKLVLSGNWIKQIEGKKLPRKLKFLECFVNEISDIRPLTEKCPSRIKHIGLGRNKLTIDSGCNLLVSSGNFNELKSLDLSNNDILDLTALLAQLRGLPRLTCLSLEGNPCYTLEVYKEWVLYEFPKLLYLDNTEILDEDRELDGCCVEERENSSGLIFTCYRLIGIPPPPKGANIIHTFHLEIEVPIMEEIKLPEPPPPPPPPPVEEKVKGKGKQGKEGKGKKGKDKKSDKSKKDKKSKGSKGSKKEKKVKLPKPAKGKGLYAIPNEYDAAAYKKMKNKIIKTEPREWDTVIKFNNPAIIVPTPHDRTFEEKKKGKGKKQKKKDEKGKKDQTKTPGKEEEEEEIILKRATFATFFCNLHTVNWSDQYVDYVWADFPKVGKNAIPVEGSLKPEVYSDGGGKGKSSKGSKTKSSKGSKGKGKSEDSDKTTGKTKEEKPPLPTKLTCHVGFGMKRCGQVQEFAKKAKGTGKGKGKKGKKK